MKLIKVDHIEYLFLTALLVFQICLTIILDSINISGFSATPYIRFGVLFFTSLFFLNNIITLKIHLKFKIKISLQHFFILIWLLFSCIELIVGIFIKNPLIYIVTDFLYILFGYLLYQVMIEINRNNQVTEDRVFFKLSITLVIIAYNIILFNLNAPSELLILMVVLMYINIINRKYLLNLLIIIPYFLIVVNSNRSQLIVFFLMLFILFLKSTRKYFSLRTLVLYSLLSMVLIFLLKEKIIDGLLYFVNPKSNIGFRINQISVILKEGIDYSNPYFTSISQRILESKEVIRYWTQDIFSFIFGAGMGGVIDGSKIYNDNAVLNSALLGAKKIHNIHLLPFALIYRYGLFGIILIFVLIKIVYNSFLTILNENRNTNKIFWNLFLLTWFVFSISASSFLWTMPIFWMSLAFSKNS